MIQAGLEFLPSARRLVIETFLTLPGELRPTHQSADEDGVGTELKDHGRFPKTVMKRETGFFLKGANVTYDLNFVKDKPIVCNCFLETDTALAKDFLIHMASAQPIFGFACEPEEREWRNRITIKLGVNSIESWVGRDTQKYIPGLYWLTLLSTVLMEKHNVQFTAIEALAQEHVVIEGGQHLFCFYRRPDSWRSATGVVTLSPSLPGVFDVEKVRPQLATAKNFLDLSVITRGWK